MTGPTKVLELNYCAEPSCRCGWNIKIGSGDYVMYEKLVRFLKENGVELA